MVRTVVVPSGRLGFRAFLALAEVEKEYSQMLRELVGFAYANGVISFTKLKAVKYQEMRRKYFRGVQKAIEEEARERGVPVVYVNPRNTSRLCPIHGASIKYDGRTRLGRCAVGGEVWHRDVAAVWNLFLRIRGNGSTAPSPRARELSVDGSSVPLGSTVAHEPIRISRSVWARWKSLPQTVNQSKAVGTNGSGQKMSTSL